MRRIRQELTISHRVILGFLVAVALTIVMVPIGLQAHGVATISRVSPIAVDMSKPTPVTIMGSNFSPNAQVYFNGLTGTSVSVNPERTRIVVTSPTFSTAGPVLVTVRTGGGSASISASNTGLLCAAPAAAPILTSSIQSLESCGTQLWVNGGPVLLHGFNTFSLGTDWAINQGCGGDFSTIAPHQTFASGVRSFFTSLAPGSVVRFDAFQTTIGEARGTNRVNWTPLDTVIQAATESHVYVIPVLADEWGACDDGRVKDLSWFQNAPGVGYASPAVRSLLLPSGIAETPAMSYSQWVAAVVARYASSPAVSMWEPIGEPEADRCLGGPVKVFAQCNNGAGASCSGADSVAATSALTHFFDVIGSLIHSLDPGSLVEEGALGSGQCGLSGDNYAMVGASSGIDVLSFHNFAYDNAVNLPVDESRVVMPGGFSDFAVNNFNNLPERLVQARTLNKPIIDSEFGLTACGPSSTTSTTGSFVGCGFVPSPRSVPPAITGLPLVSGASCYVTSGATWATDRRGASYVPGVLLTQRASFVHTVALAEYFPPPTLSWRAPLYETGTGRVKGLVQPDVGVSMFLVWNFSPSARSTCSYNVQPNDPVIATINNLP